MFRRTYHDLAPWNVVNSNDKKRGRAEAMRLGLSQLDNTGRDDELVGIPDPLIVGPPKVTSEPPTTLKRIEAVSRTEVAHT